MNAEQETPDEATALAVASAPAALQTMERAPDIVLAEAQKAARALQDVLASKPRKVMMNDRQYLEFEDWQTLGRFFGISSGVEGEAEPVNVEGVAGFRARSVALDRTGRVISRATAYCMRDEEKWGARTKYEWAYVKKSGGHSLDDPGKDEIIWEDNPSKPGKKRPRRERVVVGTESVPLFQLASMAQTRANAKVLRNVLSWVAVLAGYAPTPAEEVADLPEARVVETRAPDASAPVPLVSEAPETPRAAATGAQLAKIGALLAESGYGPTEKEKRLAIVSGIVKRDLRSAADLSKAEASMAIEALTKRLIGITAREIPVCGSCGGALGNDMDPETGDILTLCSACGVVAEEAPKPPSVGKFATREAATESLLAMARKLGFPVDADGAVSLDADAADVIGSADGDVNPLFLPQALFDDLLAHLDARVTKGDKT